MGNLSSKDQRDKKRSISRSLQSNKRRHSPRPLLSIPSRQNVSKATEAHDCEHDSYRAQCIRHNVEAFEPVIVRYVKVTELAQFLPSIDSIDTFRNMNSSRMAMKLLIKRLKRNKDVGVWQEFVDALNFAGYEYISQLVMGETEEDHTEQVQLLNLLVPRLVEDMYVEEFLDKLYERRVISVRDKEEIEAELKNEGPSKASLLLLSRVPGKLTRWYTEFTEILTESGMAELADWFKQHSKDLIKTDGNTNPKEVIVDNGTYINVRTRQRCSDHVYADLFKNQADAFDDTFDADEPYSVTEVEPTEDDIAIKNLKREIEDIDKKTKKQEEIKRLKQVKRERLEECRKIESDNNKVTLNRRPKMDHVTQTTTGEEIAERRSMLESMQKVADDKKNVLRLEVKKQVLTREISQIEADIQNVQVVDNGISASSQPVEVDIDTAREFMHNEDYYDIKLRQQSRNIRDRQQYVNQANLPRKRFMDSGVFTQSMGDLNF